ncbi:MAG: phage shock protein C [Candidatus Azotimanducaceae bacterium]|jgi:phage shock protein C
MNHRRYSSTSYREFERDFDEKFETDKTKPEIFLDKRRRKLGGVCAGVSRYFNIQSLLVRLGTVVVFFIAPQVVLIAYGLAYLILDDHP